MVKFWKTEIGKEKFYAARKTMKFWDFNVDNIVISKLVTTKTNSKYMIGYLDKEIKPVVLTVVLIMPKCLGRWWEIIRKV